MALSIIKPFVHVEDANGNPYVGAKLYVYLPGTTTPAAIYSDEGLSIALSNPLTGVTGSDAAGNFPRAYIAAGRYKLRAETVASVLIWEMDNIDTGLSAGSGALPIASGGTGGTTATAARTNLDVPSNSELAALASDITDIQSSLQNIVSVPQGYLTPTTGVPVIITGVAAGTAVYYTPFRGNLIPIYDGSQFNTVSFAELTLTLNSNHVASNIYDVFLFQDSGITTIGTGPAWNTATAGSGSRGTGAGTTELTRTKGGLWTNAFAMTARNGATTYSVNANQATYVGSIFMDGTNGQITCHRAFGQNRKWSVWNAYNRVPIIIRAGDTGGGSATTTGYAALMGSIGNSLSAFCGLAEEMVLLQSGVQASASTAMNMFSAVGANSTTVASGQEGVSFGSGAGGIQTPLGRYAAPPALGNNVYTMLYKVSTGTATIGAGEAYSLMTAQYNG